MDFTISMALIDFLPVILFSWGAMIFGKCFYAGMKKFEFAMFSTGAMNIAAAGSLKAIWKLLYAAGICDFQKLNAIFFPLQTLGFLFIALGVCCFVFGNRNSKFRLLSVAPIVPVYNGTFLFVTLMILGVLGLYVGIGALAVRMKKHLVLVFTVLSFVFILCMGYLSAKDFSQAYMNWIAQAVNILGQGLFCLCAIILRRAGLEEKIQKQA